MPVTHRPKPKSVSDVVSNLLQPSLTSHFDVLIGLPQSSLGTQLRSFLGPKQDKLHLMCSEAVLPGSSLATTEMNNDFTGVTERHAYRRIYDETIDLTFYVDADNYLPIRFFERWISGVVNEDQREALAKDYFYRVKFPDEYIADQGLKVIKFEKDIETRRQIGRRYMSLPTPNASSLEYKFVRSFPRSITSMPVTYDASSLLKCSVQMTYTRYVVARSYGNTGGGVFNPFDQALFNNNGFLGNTAANLVDSVVDRMTGNDFVGDVAGGFAAQAVRNLF